MTNRLYSALVRRRGLQVRRYRQACDYSTKKDGSDEFVESIGGCSTSAVHDVMRELGFERFVLPHNIRPLLAGQKLSGRI